MSLLLVKTIHCPQQVRALIIENTFTSLVELVPVVLPILRPVIGPGRYCWPSFITPTTVPT